MKRPSTEKRNFSAGKGQGNFWMKLNMPQDAVAVSGFCRLGRAAVVSLAGHSIINGSLHPYPAEAATAETMLASQRRRTENAALQQADS